MALLVTGGTGLVGSHLIEFLIEKGHQPSDIKALVRPRSDTAFLQEKGVLLYYGDLLDFTSLKTALRDVNIIFHCAAAFGDRDQQRTWQVNFHGTENLLEAARLASVGRFIYVSSVGIYGLLEVTPATEEHPKHPLRPYACSKLAAENKVWEYYQKYGLPSVILRPSLVIGERDRHITKLMMEMVRRKIIPLVNGGKACVSFVYAKDVARALFLASIREKPIGQAYNVESFSTPLRNVVQFFIKELGVKAKILNIPFSLAYALALGLEGFYAVVKRKRHPLLPKTTVRRFITDMAFDITKIKTELDYAPRFTMQEAFLRSLRWQLRNSN